MKFRGYFRRLSDQSPAALWHLKEALRVFRPIPADALDLRAFSPTQRAQIRMNYTGPGGCQTCYDTDDVPGNGSPGFNGHERAWNRCPVCRED